MKNAAIRIHALMTSLKIAKARVVGHDIGLMVAYAYAAMYPTDTAKLVLMDAFLPGIGGWQTYYHDPALWHFFFNGPTPEALVKGRERARACANYIAACRRFHAIALRGWGHTASAWPARGCRRVYERIIHA